MKTIKELNIDIINVTMKIHQDYPELSKYIKEMPLEISINDAEEISRHNLLDYYNSLTMLLQKYAPTHSKAKLEKEIGQ